MKLKQSFLKKVGLCTAGVALGLASMGASAAKTSDVEGFEQVLFYMGTGIFDPAVSEPRLGLTDCVGLFCGGDYFQKEVMGRTDAETAQVSANAKAFFLERFGLNVDELLAEGRVAYDMFTLNPDFQYRTRIATGMDVSEDGWIIRDGGFRLMIMDPEGIDMGGEWEGKHADHMNAFFFGNYNILATNSRGRPQEEIIVHYKASEPAIMNDAGGMEFKCEMFNEDWGTGLGLGLLTVVPLNDGSGRMRGNARNTLTFPATSTVTQWPMFPAYNSHPGR